MATLLHDPTVRDSIRGRLQRLTPSSTRAWGKMSVDQMLWHVNAALGNALGEPMPHEMTFPIPKSVIRFIVLNVPWTRGAPTAPDLVAVGRFDFEVERARCLRLIDEFTARSIDAADWGRSPSLGSMTGREWSRLQSKHLDHHLKQFSV
jgi:Protein of unknown function (DUF1569)